METLDSISLILEISFIFYIKSILSNIFEIFCVNFVFENLSLSVKSAFSLKTIFFGFSYGIGLFWKSFLTSWIELLLGYGWGLSNLSLQKSYMEFLIFGYLYGTGSSSIISTAISSIEIVLSFKKGISSISMSENFLTIESLGTLIYSFWSLIIPFST